MYIRYAPIQIWTSPLVDMRNNFSLHCTEFSTLHLTGISLPAPTHFALSTDSRLVPQRHESRLLTCNRTGAHTLLLSRTCWRDVEIKDVHRQSTALWVSMTRQRCCSNSRSYSVMQALGICAKWLAKAQREVRAYLTSTKPPTCPWIGAQLSIRYT